MKYVCLLRGVNVGGKNRVENARFRRVLEAAGFQDVRTYLNSGNAVFESAAFPDAAVIQQRLKAEFQFSIPALILNAETVLRIAEAIPTGWRNDDEYKSDVAYLFPSIDDSNIVMKISYNPVIETAVYEKGALLFQIERKNQQRSSLKRSIGTPLYQQMTIRNINTARKLAELVQ